MQGPTAVIGWLWITLTLSRTDVPTAFLDRAYDFLKDLGGAPFKLTTRIIGVTERGDLEGQLHVHLLAQVKHARCKKGLRSLTAKFVELLFPGGVLATAHRFQVKLSPGTVRCLLFLLLYYFCALPCVVACTERTLPPTHTPSVRLGTRARASCSNHSNRRMLTATSINLAHVH
jgi:hypothetical protein